MIWYNLSVIVYDKHSHILFRFKWKVAREADGARLESEFSVKANEGSNPSPSSNPSPCVLRWLQLIPLGFRSEIRVNCCQI